MQTLILVMIVVATTFEYLSKGDGWGRFGFLPREASYLGELLGGVALLYVVFAGTRNRFRYVRPAYWFMFGALLLTILAGVVLNRVEPGPMFAGIRTYLRAIPWFFIGAVVASSETDLRKQLRLLLAIALIQLPLAVEQRMHGFGGEMGAISYTGDATTGTFIISSVLSLFLICCMCMLVAFLIRKRISTGQFLLLFPALLIPTLINETKGTLVFLPLGLIVTFLAAADPRRRIRALLAASGLVILVGAVFIPVYDFFGKESNPGIVEFMTNPERSEEYLRRDVEIGSQTETPAGRLDSVVVPLRELSTDPSLLIFGYGIGNVSESALGIHYTGEQFHRFRLFMTIAFARITLELGLLGMLLVFMLMLSIYSDSLRVARLDQGVLSAVAAGMAGATVVVLVSIVYKDLTGQISMSFLFWYFAGLIAAQRMRIAAPSR